MGYLGLAIALEATFPSFLKDRGLKDSPKSREGYIIGTVASSVQIVIELHFIKEAIKAQTLANMPTESRFLN